MLPFGLALIAFVFLFLAWNERNTRKPTSFGAPILGQITQATTTTTPDATQAPGEPTPTPAPIPTPVPQPTGTAPGDRLSIIRLGVEGALIHKAVSEDGFMPNPTNPDEIVYYSFPNHPGLGGSIGQGGNAVFSGHVDWGAQNSVGCKNNTVRPPCRAVFSPLDGLKSDDTITVWVSGFSYNYRVTASFLMTGERSLDWNQILSATAQETITLITCEGEFNPQTREYGERRVVQAVRVRITPP